MHGKIIVRVFIFAAVMLLNGVYANIEANEVWLHEIGVSPHYLQDWGSPQINQTVVGTPFSIAGTHYETGVGTHAISRFFFKLNKKAHRVQGIVGADDKNDFHTKLQFKIIGDRKELWRSGVMTKGDMAKPFDVNLSGVDKVLLLVEECGDGIMYDHADWINVKFITDGEVEPIPVWAKPIPKQPYILTPAEPKNPRINNPGVYGATPGADFLWYVMASGEKPMNYEIKGLPKGLQYDKTTGIITGRVREKGDYTVTFIAKNKYGEDKKNVVIKIGDRIALTPPMGWNSWNCWRFSCDDEKVRQAADIMHEKLQAYGWNFVNIDDGWEAETRTKEGVLLGNEQFPDFKKMIDYVHSKGLKFGLYSSPGNHTCGNRLGTYGYVETDAKTWAEWGVDYLKYDYCGYMDIQKDAEEKTIQEPYVWMREAMDKAGRDVVYCVGYGAPNVWRWGAEAGGNQWRTTRDITDEWNVVLAIGTFQDVCAYATEPGRYNDPDMMVLGYVGGGWNTPKHKTLLTPDEQYSHVSLWMLLSAPMLLGCDMALIDDFTLSLITNPEVIAVNQDILCAPAVKKIVENGQIWYKPLSDGSIALGCFNVDPYYVMWDETEAETMQQREYEFTVDLNALGFNTPVTVRDIWKNKDEMTGVNGKFTVKVPYHGVKFVKLTKE